MQSDAFWELQFFVFESLQEKKSVVDELPERHTFSLMDVNQSWTCTHRVQVFPVASFGIATKIRLQLQKHQTHRTRSVDRMPAAANTAAMHVRHI